VLDSELRESNTSDVADADTAQPVGEHLDEVGFLLHVHSPVREVERTAEELRRSEEEHIAVRDQVVLDREEDLHAHELVDRQTIGEEGLGEIATNLVASEGEQLARCDLVHKAEIVAEAELALLVAARKHVASFRERTAVESILELHELDLASLVVREARAVAVVNDRVAELDELAVVLRVSILERIVREDLADVHAGRAELVDVLLELRCEQTRERDTEVRGLDVLGIGNRLERNELGSRGVRLELDGDRESLLHAAVEHVVGGLLWRKDLHCEGILAEAETDVLVRSLCGLLDVVGILASELAENRLVHDVGRNVLCHCRSPFLNLGLGELNDRPVGTAAPRETILAILGNSVVDPAGERRNGHNRNRVVLCSLGQHAFRNGEEVTDLEVIAIKHVGLELALTKQEAGDTRLRLDDVGAHVGLLGDRDVTSLVHDTTGHCSLSISVVLKCNVDGFLRAVCELKSPIFVSLNDRSTNDLLIRLGRVYRKGLVDLCHRVGGALNRCEPSHGFTPCFVFSLSYLYFPLQGRMLFRKDRRWYWRRFS